MKRRSPSMRRLAREVFKPPLRERGLRTKTRGLWLRDPAFDLLTVSAPAIGVVFEDFDGAVSAQTDAGTFYLRGAYSGSWALDDLPARTDDVRAFLDWHADGATGPLPAGWTAEDPDADGAFRGTYERQVVLELRRGIPNVVGDGTVGVLAYDESAVHLAIEGPHGSRPVEALGPGDHFQVGLTEWQVIELVTPPPISADAPPGRGSGDVVARVVQVQYLPRGVLVTEDGDLA